MVVESELEAAKLGSEFCNNCFWRLRGYSGLLLNFCSKATDWVLAVSVVTRTGSGIDG